MSIKSLFIFMAGVAVGATGAFYFAKTKYLTIADEEIESIKDSCNRKIDEMMDSVAASNTSTTKVDGPTAKELAQSNNKYKEAIAGIKDYTGYFPNDKEPEEENKSVEEDSENEDIYVIGDEDFAEVNGYSKVTLTYFEGDKTFVNVADEVENDVLKYIGEESLEHFGEYEEGVLFVRNDANKTDYEIIYDAGSYEIYAGE